MLGDIPSGCDYDLYLYSATVSPLKSGKNAGTADELFSYDVTAGETYYIKVESYNGYSSSNAYWMRAKNYPTPGGGTGDDHANGSGNATPISANTNVPGAINYPGTWTVFGSHQQTPAPIIFTPLPMGLIPMAHFSKIHITRRWLRMMMETVMAISELRIRSLPDGRTIFCSCV